MEHENEPDAGDGRDRYARDAGGDRRVVDRQSDDGGHQRQPDRGDMGIAHVPAPQVEIGEQEDDQRRAKRRLDAGAPYPLGFVLEAENLAPEPEIDADVSEHRPRQRGGGGEDQGAPDDKHRRQEQGEQAGDADHDPLVEREAGRLLLVGVRLPQVDLRQVRRPQFGDIGDCRAGIEGQPEDVGVDRVVPFRRGALARGDRGDAARSEIGPHDAGADQPEMRRDDQALQLLVQVVGQRENNPGGLAARFQRADLDAAHHAVGPRRRRDLDAVALRAVVLDHAGQVDRIGVDRHADRLHREGRLPARADEKQQRGDAQQRHQRSGAPIFPASTRLNRRVSRAAPFWRYAAISQRPVPVAAARARRRFREDRTGSDPATRR